MMNWKNISQDYILFAEIKVRMCHREVLEDYNEKLTSHPVIPHKARLPTKDKNKNKQNYRAQNCVHLLKILKTAN